MVGIVTILRLQCGGRLLDRTEETVHQEAELKKQWDDGLLISC